MKSALVLQDKFKWAVIIDAANIKYVAAWDDGSMDLFYTDGAPPVHIECAPEDVYTRLDMIKQAMSERGIEAVSLSTLRDDGQACCFRFLFDPQHIHAHSLTQVENSAHKALCLDGMLDDVVFYPSKEEKDAFKAAVEKNSDEWVVLAPGLDYPMTTYKGTYSIRKSAVEWVSGHISNNTIFKLKGGGKFSVQTLFDSSPLQHCDLAVAHLGHLKPLVGMVDSVYTDPQFFDRRQTKIRVIDGRKDKAKYAMLIHEHWHLRFESVQQAAQAMEDFEQYYRCGLVTKFSVPDVPEHAP